MSRKSATSSPFLLCALGLAGLLGACSSDTASDGGPTPAVTVQDREGARRLSKIDNVVVIYLENHSFDNLYGEFPGAQGLSGSTGVNSQVDATGTPYLTLPPIPGGQFPANLANQPFHIEQYVPADKLIPDLVHRFYQEQAQIDGGRMDRFALISDAQGLVMGNYHTMALPLAREAQQYVLCDQFFHASFGGSFLNHIWLIAARSPRWPDGPAPTGPGQFAVTTIDAAGKVIDGQVTADGYLVNTVYSVNTPALNFPYSKPRVPNLRFPTIGDRLSGKGIDWAWYSGGWNEALAGNADPLFQFHHQPFVYFANYADGTEAKAKHLRDEREFLSRAQAGTLPPVSFVKPIGLENEHPGYADITAGEQHVEDLINAVRNGPQWEHSVIIVTYDENGGFWDHVAPPVVDRWGPGARVPTLIISPLARRGVVDHHRYDTTSILALIEHRWGLAPLSDRDAKAADLSAALEPEGSGAR